LNDIGLNEVFVPKSDGVPNAVDEVVGVADERLGASLDDGSLVFFLISFGDEVTNFFG
jgi:hypothetical protein